MSGNAGTPISIKSQMGQFGMIPVWVMSMPISDGEFRIYSSIRSFCDIQGECFPTARAIAARARVGWVDDKGRKHPDCSVSAVHNAVARFRDLGMMTTEPEHRPGTRIVFRLRYHLVDLDPRRWSVVPASGGNGADSTVCTPTSAEVDPLPELSDTPYLSSGRQEQTIEHTNEQTISPPSSSSSATPRSTSEDDDDASKIHKPVSTRKPRLTKRQRDERDARSLIAEHASDSYDSATCLITKLRDDGVKFPGAYLAGVIEQDGEDKLSDMLADAEIECSAWLDGRTADHSARADAVAANLAELRPKMKPDALAKIRAAYIDAEVRGWDSATITDIMDEVLHGPRSNSPDGYVEALNAMGVRIA